MLINRERVVVSLLNEISNGAIPTEEDYGISQQQFAEIVLAVQDEGYIKNVIDAGSLEGKAVILDCCSITLKGMEYLKEHSALIKLYKGLKEVRDWIK